MGGPSSLFLRSAALAALAAPLVFLGLARLWPAIDPAIMAPEFHFYVVSGTAVAAAVACAVVIASGRTVRETRLLFLGLSFFVIAGVFSVHGIATPGFILEEYYQSVSVSAWLSASLGAALVALSTVSLPPNIERWVTKHSVKIFAAAAAAVSLYIWLSVVRDTWLDWVPLDRLVLQWSFAFSAIVLTLFAAWRYYQSYRFARLPSQLAMVAAIILLAEVQAIILWGTTWHATWWTYHALYGIAFVVLFIGWAIEASRAGTLRAIADALTMRDALAQLNRGLESPIVDLVDAVEAKDKDTFGHVRRVSGYALAIGRRLRLPADDMRNLVLAAQMHDVGKISVPDSVLAKPAPLTDEEYDIIKSHTWRGQEIAEQVPALKDIAMLVRHHHERLDGTGYPDGLQGDEIPLLARIVAVADTYDALTSKRPYRSARGHLEAMGEIVRLKGTELDPACVDALVEAFARPGARQEARQQAA
jgi:HD-GYP domain-containing protein (c-di-GMP phosphodiesterase class II)